MIQIIMNLLIICLEKLKIDDHIQYLKKIRENEYFRKYIVRLKNVEKNLQRNYRILLWLLENQHYKIIVTLLNIKNWKE